MRTLRNTLLILCLAALLTSTAAWAAPAERGEESRSPGSWVLAVLDSILERVERVLPAAFADDAFPADPAAARPAEKSSQQAGDAPTGAPEPTPSLQSDGDLGSGKVGGGVDPHG